ncbi:ABC transporter substrate-binding protein [Nonomuraea sp. bgisy101]|uniref:ABC transporter substrate-binding protein n=1 Tax=Nonomuraea sp. bgisy101 TaxID=3413784 RepID=UPI003D73D14A
MKALLAAVAALVTLTGCATGGVQQAAPSIAPSSQKLSGEVKVWSFDVGAKALQRLAPEFMKLHPGVKVEVTDVGYDNVYDKITVGLQSGSGLPDVVHLEDERVSAYAKNFPNGLVDLAPVAGKYKSDFDPAKWQTASGPGGKLYALPWDSAPVGLFYRRDYFEQAGVKAEDVTTWDELVTAGLRVKAKTGKRLFVSDLGNITPLFTTLLQQQGQGIFKDGKVAVNSAAGVKALTLMARLNKQGLLQNEKGWDGRVTATKEGKAATAPTAVWWSGTLTSEMPELSGKFGVVPLPAFEAGGVRTSANGGSMLAVTGQTRNQQAAYAFAEFVTANKDSQLSMMKTESLFPAYLPALADPYFGTPVDYFGGQPVNQIFAEQVRDIPPVESTDDDAEAAELLKTLLSRAVVGGEDPRTVLDEAAKQISAATKREIAAS